MKYLFRTIRNVVAVRYLLSGMAAGAVQLGSLYLLVEFFDFWYVFGSTLSFVLTWCVSFLLQKFWTFKERGTARMPVQAIQYLVMSLGNLVLNTALIYALTEAGLWYLASQVVAIGVLATVSFFVYKYAIFRL